MTKLVHVNPLCTWFTALWRGILGYLKPTGIYIASHCIASSGVLWCAGKGLVFASFKLVRLKQRCTLFSWFAATSGGSFLFLFLFYGGADDTD